MARGYRPVDRDQWFLMPPSLREWLPADHLAWFVLDTVEQMDTSSFHDRYPKAGAGRRAFDPDVLLGVLIYAYAIGERSSRRIETACRENVAFQVLCARDVPDHTVISRFRATHQDRFAEVFTQVLQMCWTAGMGRLGTIAIDGTKIAANASLQRNRTEESLREEHARHQQGAQEVTVSNESAQQASQEAARQVARRVLAEAAQADAVEDELYGDARGDEVAPEFADPSTRAAAIARALAEIEAQKKKIEEEGEDQTAQSQAHWAQRIATAQARLAVQLEEAAAKVAAWQAANAAAEADTTGALKRPAGRVPVIENAQVRRSRAGLAGLHKLAEQAKGSPRRAKQLDKTWRANPTDPESRTMNTRLGWVQGYNAQLAVTEDHLILALMLTQDPLDIHAFVPVLNSARDTAAALTDQPITQPITQPVTQPVTEPVTEPIGMVLADAGYFSTENLTAPGPDRLIAAGKDREQRAVAASLAADPADQPADAEPTDPITTTDATDADVRQRMRERLKTKDGAAAYARRGGIVEPVNGHLKDQIGLRRFSRRGHTAAASELNLAAAVTNLLKLHRYTTTAAAAAAT